MGVKEMRLLWFLRQVILYIKLVCLGLWEAFVKAAKEGWFLPAEPYVPNWWDTGVIFTASLGLMSTTGWWLPKLIGLVWG